MNVQGWGEALVNPPLLATVSRVIDTYRDTTTEIIKKAQASGQIDRGIDPGSLSSALISLYYGLELQLALEPRLNVDGYTQAVRALLQPGVLAAARE